MIRALNLIKEKLSYLIIGSMILGLAVGYVVDVSFLKAAIKPVLFLMVYPMMITLKTTDLFQGLSKPKPLLISIAINFIVSPLIAFSLGKIFFANEPMLLTGLILIALIPTSGMTASWTGLANGNMKSALIMISGNLLLSIIMTPIYMKLFLGKVIAVNTIAIVKSLVEVVVIPLILGDLTRRLIVKRTGEEKFKKIKPHFSSVSSIGVLLAVFQAIALKSRTIVGESQLVLYSLIPLVLYYGILLVVSHTVGNRFLDRPNRISLVYGTTMRNLTIALGLSLSAFGGSLAVLLIAIGYVIQVPMAAFYMQSITKQNNQEVTAKP